MYVKQDFAPGDRVGFSSMMMDYLLLQLFVRHDDGDIFFSRMAFACYRLTRA